MVPSSPCPESGRFQALRKGPLPPDEVERLATHLEQCEACAAEVEPLLSEATPVGLLRGQPAGPERPEEDTVLQPLMQRLKALPGTRDGPRTPATSTDDTAEIYARLAPPQRPDEIGRLGPYRVRRLLGSGGMALVFEAEDMKLGRAVALKVMRPRLGADVRDRERFLREARAAAALRHDHVVTIFQAGEDNDVPYITMELLSGESLAERLARPERLTTAEFVRLGRQIAEGLAAAHAAGLIHRDVKPSNIWLDAAAGGRVKLLDFGLARPAGEDLRLTQSGLIVGTPSYMAPEQARGEEVDGRADLFSLGCVLYEMCTGQPPFQAPNTLALLTALATDTPTPLRRLNPAVPPALAELVERLLAKAPADRPASARIVADTLAALESGSPVPRSRSGHRRFGVVGAVLLAAVLLGALALRFPPTGSRVTDAAPVQPPTVAEAPAPTDADSWEKSVARLAPAAQVNEVARKIQELNPGYQGTLNPTIDRGGVIRLELTAVKLTNLTPLRALPDLQHLTCQAGEEEFGALKDLSPLRGLPLKSLDLKGNNQLKDLEPLEALPLEVLMIYGCTPVTDLGPLRRMYTLRELDCGGTKVSSLTPLRRLSLTTLILNDCRGIDNVTPLEGMPLVRLSLAATRVEDLGPLDSLKQLKSLNLSSAPRIKNLAPLRALELDDLQIQGTGATNLAPLQDAPLRSLTVGADVARANRTVLQGMKRLHEINYRPAEQFWKEQDAKMPKQ